MKKIKVIHLLETLKLGGMEKMVYMSASQLDRTRFEVEVWALSEGGNLEARAEARGLTFRVMGLHSYYNPLNIVRLAWELRKADADILHVHGYFSSTFGRLAGLLAMVPVMIAHLHTTFHSLNLRNRLIDRFLNLFTARIICVSEAVRNSFFAMGYGGKEKFIVIYNGIEEFKYALPRAEHGAPLLFNAASLYPHKGHKFLLDAFRSAKERIPDLRLQIAGDGPLLKELLQYCLETGIASSVGFLGERNDIPVLLSSSALFVFTAVREGLSLACVEAMAAGVPVVCFDTGGLKEVVVDGETGVLCAPGDVAAMSDAIVRLVSDPAKRAAMGENAKARVREKFSLGRRVKIIEELYERLLAERGPGK